MKRNETAFHTVAAAKKKAQRPQRAGPGGHSHCGKQGIRRLEGAGGGATSSGGHRVEAGGGAGGGSSKRVTAFCACAEGAGACSSASTPRTAHKGRTAYFGPIDAKHHVTRDTGVRKAGGRRLPHPDTGKRFS